jgi:glycosyltransferase involved in cell wall biosynthesis
MKKLIEQHAINNVVYFPNFKRLNIVDKEELNMQHQMPYKLCTFSRVLKEKGIEDAINAVNIINEKIGYITYTLDIYGQIDSAYKTEFYHIMKNVSNEIQYKGIVEFDKTVDVLKNYFALLFPSYYDGEGFPGTILDAFAAGLPVIATDWKYNSEIILNDSDGLIYSYNQKENLIDILYKISMEPNKLLDMKSNCIDKAKTLSPENVIKILVNNMD